MQIFWGVNATRGHIWNTCSHYYTSPVMHMSCACFKQRILCLVDRASWIICVQLTNTTHCLSSLYWVNTPGHVSVLFVAHQQEVECICLAHGTCFTSKTSVGGPWWKGTFHPGPPTNKLKVTQVPFATYIHSTSRWWATNRPETCPGVLTQ
jgi:hypothetical protein